MTEKGEKARKNEIWLYFFGFLLMWEWLRPVGELTDTGYLPVFILFLALSLTISYINMKPFLRIVIMLVYMFYTLNFIYFEGSFFKFGWVFTVIDDVWHNTELVIDGRWTELSDFFRSFLFFILLSLMTYLLRYWLINRKQIFVFFFMTLVYITVLDTFTPFEADQAIVRTVIIGFTLMGVLTFLRIIEKEKLENSGIQIGKWLVPMVIMICGGVLIGFATPKASPIWPDPVPYIKSYATGSGAGGTVVGRKVGYGQDDSRLGGPFIGDDTAVYEVETRSRHYWKVETKDIYTGKGWLSSNANNHWISFDQETNFPIITYLLTDLNLQEQKSKIRPLYNYPHLIYPLGLKTIENDQGYSYEVDVGLEKIFYIKTGDLGISEYSVTHVNPRYSISLLMETVDDRHPVLTEEFVSHYTQLPEGLPNRVMELAIDITRDKETWYDKAKAIENYFDGIQFQYSQTDVAFPDAEQDYVDQFLFETQKGYCDNFSTSMVVLLRSIGIPARWVKGYTEGNYRGLTDEGQRLYLITNNHAHSWVEVFFPEVGWVPFEPTKGFTNSAQFSYDNLNIEVNVPEQRDPLQIPETELEEGKDNSSSSSSSFSLEKVWDKVKDFLIQYWRIFFYSAMILALIIFVMYRTRIKWLPRYFILRYHFKNKDDHFPHAYMTLLKQLERYGLPRKPDQTLSDYALRIDQFFSTSEMGELTRSYEKYLYKGELEKGTWKEKKEIWENLIKKVSA